MQNCPETIATTNYEVEYASALKKNNFTELNFILRKAVMLANKF
jgi:glutamine amidotransferase